MRRVIEPKLGFHAQCAIKDIGSTAAILAYMVGREANEAIAAQAVGARVTDMKEMGDAAAQHHGGEGAAHAAQFVVTAALRKDPAIERVEHRGAGAADFHGFGEGAKTREKTAHRRLRREAPAPPAARAGTPPPLAPPIPSANAAIISRRGLGNSIPKTAPAKSSLRSRGPVSEAKPTLALMAIEPSAIADALRPR